MSFGTGLIQLEDVTLGKIVQAGRRRSDRIPAYRVGTMKSDPTQVVLIIAKTKPKTIDQTNEEHLVLLDQLLRFNPTDWIWNWKLLKKEV